MKILPLFTKAMIPQANFISLITLRVLNLKNGYQQIPAIIESRIKRCAENSLTKTNKMMINPNFIVWNGSKCDIKSPF